VTRDGPLPRPTHRVTAAVRMVVGIRRTELSSGTSTRRAPAGGPPPSPFPQTMSFIKKPFPEWRVTHCTSMCDTSLRKCTKHILSSDVSHIAQSCMIMSRLLGMYNSHLQSHNAFALSHKSTIRSI